MKGLFLFCFFIAVICCSVTAQENRRADTDSLWYFHPFSIDLSAGTWLPAGELSHFFNPSLQFGVQFGLSLDQQFRFQLGVFPRILFPAQPVKIRHDGELSLARIKAGGSVGGWVSYLLFQNRSLRSELLTGITYEGLTTDILRQARNRTDTIIIRGIGFTAGTDVWLNVFKRANVGVKAMYAYATFDNSKYLTHNMGGNSVSVSLMYRVPRRDPENSRYYRRVSGESTPAGIMAASEAAGTIKK